MPVVARLAMPLRIARLARLGALCLAVGLGASRAEAQLSCAELFVDMEAGVSASDEGVPLASETFSLGPITEDVFLDGETLPIDIDVARGGASAFVLGDFIYSATDLTRITSSGDFTMSSTASTPASALVGFDVVTSIRFEVTTQTTFALTGHVSTQRALSAPEVVACQYNGVVLAGDSRATPLAPGTYPFDVERTLFPGETGTLDCSAASSGGMTDDNHLTWAVTVNGLPEPGAGAAALGAIGALAALRSRRDRR